MQRFVAIGFAALLLAPTASAQKVDVQGQPSAIRPQSQQQQTTVPLRNEARLRYLVRQVDLTKEQKAHVEGLLELYRADLEYKRENLNVDEVRALVEEIRVATEAKEAAEKEGNTESAKEAERRIELAQERLRDMAPGVREQAEFFQELEKILTSQQKQQLEAARKRLDRSPDGRVRPVDIVKLAQSMGLSEQQQAKLREVLIEFRDEMSDRPSDLSPDQERAMLQRFRRMVRAILTAGQREKFDARLERMMPEGQAAMMAQYESTRAMISATEVEPSTPEKKAPEKKREEDKADEASEDASPSEGSQPNENDAASPEVE